MSNVPPRGARAGAEPLTRARISDEEHHQLVMLLADLVMADLARRPPRE